MRFSGKLLAYGAAVICAAAEAQDALAQAVPASSPVAYVYISTSSSGKYTDIKGFYAAANGALTPISGSPFAASLSYMALNGKYLFGTDGTYIYSFSIAPNGSLQQVSSINAASYNPPGLGSYRNLVVRRRHIRLRNRK
jgi:hypothetical protein